jgi:Zn-dependent protease with chaperone function
MQFEAIALSNKFPRGRKPGTLEVINGALCFIDRENKVYGLPLQGGKITQGGAGNRYIYFTHPSYPDLTFYTDDREILKLPDIKFDQTHAPAGKKIRNNHRLALASVYTFLGIIVALILSLFIFRGAIVEHIASLLSPAQEQEIASQMRESAIAGKKIVTDTSIQRRLEMMTSPLVNAVENKEFRFSFTIIEDETLNAYALPGGAIIIHSGLIEKAKSPEEVAGVLAHEISHVTRRHHVRGIIGNMGIYVIVRGFLGDITGVSAEIATAGATLSSLKYSRGFEIEADESGWKLLNKANVDPQGMISFFETMKKEQGDVQVSEFISTHPATEERIKKLKEKKQEHGAYINFPFNFEEFKKDIRTYFKNDKSSWK